MERPEGTISTSIGLTGSRIEFIDVYGLPAATYPLGSKVHVRVEDQNSNRQGLWDTVRVTLRGLRWGDDEELILQEVHKDSGIFEGSIEMSAIEPAYRDGLLQAQPEEEIEVTHEDYFGATSSKDRARIAHAGILFIDAAGQPETELVEGGTARVRVVSRDANSTPNSRDGLSVTVRSRYTGDSAQVWLDETGVDTSVFEGGFNLGPANGVTGYELETGNSGPPEFRGDEVVAEYGPYRAQAVTIGSRMVFLDAFGSETASYVPGESIRLRVLNPTSNATPFERNVADVQLQAGSDQEMLRTEETGADTGIFEGALPSAGRSATSDNGILEAFFDTEIVATLNNNFPEPTVARARMAGASLLFVDAQGQPVQAYLEGTRAYLRVFSGSHNDTLTVTVQTALALDNEEVTVTATSPGPANRLFLGSIQLRPGAATPGDGILQTSRNNGSPLELDTLGAFLPRPEGTLSTTIGLIGSRISFVDAGGAAAETYAEGSTAYLQVEDHTFNNPGSVDTVPVTVTGNADSETVFLTETGIDTGVYQGSLALGINIPVTPNNGVLQAVAGQQIVATHQDLSGVSSTTDQALLTDGTLHFVDEAGEVTSELLAGGDGWLRVFSRGANYDPASADVITVEVFSQLGGDYEMFGLTETGPDTSVFLSRIPLGPMPPAAFDQRLSTAANDTVTARFVTLETTARTVSARISFRNLRGEPVTRYALGSPIRVRVEEPLRGTPDLAENVQVRVETLNLDEELVLLAETGLATGVFEGEIPSLATPTSQGNGTLTAYPGATLRLTHYPLGTFEILETDAEFTGNSAPQAVEDFAETVEAQPVVIPVLANDGDPDFEPFLVEAVTQGENGTVAINLDGTVTYTPAAGFLGTDAFTYQVVDAQGGEARGTVTVTVISANGPPAPVADTATTLEDEWIRINVLGNDVDPNDDPLEVVAITQPSIGGVVINGDQTITYMPEADFFGTGVTFTYTVRDPGGLEATATVTVTVTSVNDLPEAAADTATTAEDQAAVINVVANDSDVETPAAHLLVTAVTQGTNGTVVINPDSTVTYTPNANFSGADAFTYTISDGNGGTDTATVNVTVSAVNDAPVAVDDTASTVARSAATFAVLANDSDMDSASLTVASVTQPANGSVAVNADQTVTFTPAPFFVGTTGFSYTVSDGGGTATANVTVTVTKPNRTAANLQALYDFEEGSGSTVNDVSGVGTPLDLTIGDSSAVSWVTGGLAINSATVLQSTANATKVVNAAKASNEITVEAWVVPANLAQSGMARIVTISQNNNKRNVTLGQSGNRIESRLRTSTTGGSGTSQLSPVNSLTTNLTHVVFTRSSAGTVTTYIDGVAVSTSTISGNFSNWDTGLKLGIGAGLNGGDAWRGQLYLVAVYSRALTANEVALNLLAGHQN